MADREFSGEVKEMIGAWRDVRRVSKKLSKDGITPAERAEIKKEIIEAITETADVLGAGATFGRDALKKIETLLNQLL